MKISRKPTPPRPTAPSRPSKLVTAYPRALHQTVRLVEDPRRPPTRLKPIGPAAHDGGVR